MVLNSGGRRARAKTLSDDDFLNHTALVTLSEKIRDGEAGYQQKSMIPAGELKRDHVQPAVYTIAEWCEAFRVSRGHFYNLLRRGEGPRVLRLGRRVVISAEATAEFVRRSEAITKAELSRGAER